MNEIIIGLGLWFLLAGLILPVWLWLLERD